MHRAIARLIEVLASIGARESDTDRETLHKRFLVYVAVLMSCGGLVWGSICVYLELPITAAIPFGYVLLSAVNLTCFSVTAQFRVARFFQLLISLLLPFLFQWAMGGFIPSGVVMLWAMTAVLGALTFQEISITLRWFLAYLVLTIASGMLEGGPATLFVLNVVGVSVIVFGLTLYFIRSNEIAYDQLAQASRKLVNSQVELVRAEKMVSVGSPTAGITHEMNTPLGVINSNADVASRCVSTITDALKEGGRIDQLDNSEQVKRCLDLLQTTHASTVESSARITGLVDNLRRFAKLDEAPRQNVDLHEGIDSALELLKPDLGDRIEMVKNYGDIPHVTCYANSLNHVFMDVLRNAAEAIRGPSHRLSPFVRACQRLLPGGNSLIGSTVRYRANEVCSGHFASGSGRSWKCMTLLVVPLPPSI
jgi:signal transduction histidine kinase